MRVLYWRFSSLFPKPPLGSTKKKKHVFKHCFLFTLAVCFALRFLPSIVLVSFTCVWFTFPSSLLLSLPWTGNGPSPSEQHFLLAPHREERHQELLKRCCYKWSSNLERITFFFVSLWRGFNHAVLLHDPTPRLCHQTWRWTGGRERRLSPSVIRQATQTRWETSSAFF